MARHPPLSLEVVETIAALGQAGTNAHQIALRTGASAYHVRRVLSERGLYRRSNKHGYSNGDALEPQPEDWAWCMWPGCRQERRRGHGLCYGHEKIARGLITA